MAHRQILEEAMRLANKVYRQIHGLLRMYSLPVAPLALPKCYSVINVYTRPRTTWTTGAVMQASVFRFRVPFYNSPLLTPFFSTVMSPF